MYENLWDAIKAEQKEVYSFHFAFFKEKRRSHISELSFLQEKLGKE